MRQNGVRPGESRLERANDARELGERCAEQAGHKSKIDSLKSSGRALC